MREEITRKLVVKLSESELAERGEEMAVETMKKLRLEFQRSAINRAIKPHKERSEELAAVIEAGEEERSVLCYWSYDWRMNLRYLYRSDTGEQIDTELIPEGKKQTDLFDVEVPRFVPEEYRGGIFAGCPVKEGDRFCVYVRLGNACAPALCGKFPGCKCPKSAHIEESNAVTCGVCNRVIKAAPFTRYPGGAGPDQANARAATMDSSEDCAGRVPVGDPNVTTPFSSDGNTSAEEEQNPWPAGMDPSVYPEEYESGSSFPEIPVAPCVNLECEHMRKDLPDGCGYPNPLTQHLDDCPDYVTAGEELSEREAISAPDASITVEEEVSPVGEGESITFVTSTPPDPERTCCLPKDRDITGAPERRIMYCRECGLVTKIEDTSGPSVENWKRLDVPSFTYMDLKHVQGER